MKNKLCIVHIGMPKTGSSTLQQVFFRSISDDNVSYANLKGANHSADIFSLFSDVPQNHYFHKEMNHTKEEIDTFNRKNKDLLISGFLNSVSSTTIISGEDIFHMSENAIQRMKDFLLEYFEKVIIVGYIRHPISFMNSSFQQLVKNHYIDNFDFNMIYPQYKFKLEKFDKVFGKENVYFIDFNPKKFPNNDIVSDFSNRFNVSFDYDKKKSVNESISRELISILFIDNKFNKKTFGKYNIRVKNNLIESLRSIGNTKFSFSSKIIDKVFEIYKDDVKWLFERMVDDFSRINTFEDTESSVKSEEDLSSIHDTVFKELINTIGLDDISQNLLVNTTENIARILAEYKERINFEMIKNDNGFIPKGLVLILCIDYKYNKEDFGQYNINIKNNLVKNLSSLEVSDYSVSISLSNLSYEKYVEAMNILCKKVNNKLSVSNDAFDELINIVGRGIIPEKLLINTTDNVANILALYKEKIKSKVIEKQNG